MLIYADTLVRDLLRIENRSNPNRLILGTETVTVIYGFYGVYQIM